MRIVSEDFATLTKNICTTFEGLSFEEIANLAMIMTKVNKIDCKPFRHVNHSLQMKRPVYDMAYESVHYIIERVFRDEEGTVMITLLEHTDGGYNWTPETIEWTFDIDEVLHGIIGLPMSYHWGE